MKCLIFSFAFCPFYSYCPLKRGRTVRVVEVVVFTLERGSEQIFGNEGEMHQQLVVPIGNVKERRWTKLLPGLLRCCLAHSAAALDGQSGIRQIKSTKIPRAGKTCAVQIKRTTI